MNPIAARRTRQQWREFKGYQKRWHKQTIQWGAGRRNNITRWSVRKWQIWTRRIEAEILVRNRRLTIGDSRGWYWEGNGVVSLCWAGCMWDEAAVCTGELRQGGWCWLAGRAGQDQWIYAESWMTELVHFLNFLLRVFRSTPQHRCSLNLMIFWTCTSFCGTFHCSYGFKAQ